MDQISAVAPWPAIALTLLWLARRRPAVYARAAVALLLSCASGLVYSASSAVQNLPAQEATLFREYVASPGVLTGWYLLMALAVAAGISAIRTRLAVVVGALTGVAASVLAFPHPGLAAVWSAAVPLCSWFVAGYFQRRSLRSRPAPGGDQRGRVISARPLPRATEEQRAHGLVPLRQAG